MILCLFSSVTQSVTRQRQYSSRSASAKHLDVPENVPVRRYFPKFLQKNFRLDDDDATPEGSPGKKGFVHIVCTKDGAAAVEETGLGRPICHGRPGEREGIDCLVGRRNRHSDVSEPSNACGPGEKKFLPSQTYRVNRDKCNLVSTGLEDGCLQTQFDGLYPSELAAAGVLVNGPLRMVWPTSDGMAATSSGGTVSIAAIAKTISVPRTMCGRQAMAKKLGFEALPQPRGSETTRSDVLRPGDLRGCGDPTPPRPPR